MSPHEHEHELLLRHRAWLRALAARLVGAGLADDLAQETWVAALRRPPDPERPARPWLATVAGRLALRLRGPPEAPESGPEREAPSTDELLERVELETRLAREVARLAEPFRRTVLLRYHEGLSAAEIARRDGVPAGTVRWRLKRGLDELRGRLDREFGDRKSWAALLAALAGVEGAAGGVGLSMWANVAGAAALAAVLAAGGARWLAEREGPEAAPRDAREETQLAAASAPEPDAVERVEPGAAPEAVRREVERSAPPVAQAPARGLSLEVVDWDGTPGADLLVALRSRARPTPGEPVALRTDAAGRVAFPEAEGRVEVVVERSGKPLLRELEADGGEHRLELPRGAVVSGRVQIGGEVPVQPVVLELYWADEPGSRADNPSMRLDSLFGDNPLLRTATDTAGAFAFFGLEQDWSGILRAPRGYLPRGRVGHQLPYEGHSVFLPEPTEGIELDLDRCPGLRGRVVDQDGALGVPYATVTVQPTAPYGTSGLYKTGTDFEGRFEVFLDDLEFRSVHVWIGAPGSSLSQAEHAFTRADVSPDGDLGDLRLGPGRSVTLRVADPAGRPIEGALISKEMQASDARGELVVSGLWLEEASVWVAARGYVGAQVALPKGMDTLDVVLAPANELEVVVRDRAGLPLPRIEVQVATEGPVFIGPSNRPDDLTRDGPRDGWGGVSRHHGGTMDGPSTYSFTTNDEGRVALASMHPGASLRVAVVSRCAVPLCEERVEAPAAGDRRTVVLAVAQDLCSLAVRVVDPSGVPVARAQVRLALAVHDAGRRREDTYSRTDDRGSVALSHLTRDAYRLVVSKAGHLPAVRDPLQVPGGELVLVLERGLDVVVRVRDTAGRTMTGGYVQCDVLGERRSFLEIEDGRIDVLGLPDQPTELAMVLAGATYTLQHDPRRGEAEFVVPEHGSAIVSWAAPAGADWSPSMRIALVPEDGTQKPLEAGVTDTPAGEWTFPLVLPGFYTAVLDRELPEESEPRDLTHRVRIEVRAGDTARVELVPLEGWR